MNALTSRLIRLVATGLLVVAAPAAAQSRIAVLDATGVSVLDTATGQVRARFELSLPPQESPHHITASADGVRLLVATSQSPDEGALYVLDASNGETLARIPTPKSNGRPVVLPDGSRAFVVFTTPGDPFGGAAIASVDLSAFTSQLYSSSELSSCTMGSSLAVRPDGGMLYLRCSPFQSARPPNPRAGHLLSIPVTPTGLGPDARLPQTAFEPNDLSVSPDGTRLLVSASSYPEQRPILEVYDTATQTLLDSYELLFRMSKPGTISLVRAQSASRVFMRLTINPYHLTTPLEETALFDEDTETFLGQASVAGVLVGDQAGALTFGLEANRLSRLDNDTSAATTIATGPGGWLDAAVLTDTCPLAVTASSHLFTTTGGTGTLTIDAAPACAWTVDAGELHGVSFGGASSGQGSATLDFSLAPATAPQRGALHVGPHAIALEQTMPVTHIDAPAGGAIGQPFTLRGWAIDVSVTPPAASPTVSIVHVWAWPTDGGAPHFVGATGAAIARPDVGAVYGSGYDASGFELSVRGLPSGLYTIVAYAQGARGGTFAGQAGVVVMVQAATLVAIDMPDSIVPRHFVVSGWAIDPSAVTGPGVDAVHVWAYPAGGGAPIWVGAAAYGGARTDIAALFGASFANSSYWLFGSLPPGDYTLAVSGRSTVTGEFTGAGAALRVTADSAPEMNLEAPDASSSPIAGSFEIRGWAIDRGAASGSGVDAFHIWAFPIAGGDPRFVGVGAPVARPDVAGIVGPQFANAGFLLSSATLPAGTYDLVVYAHSSVTQTFNNYRVVRITVP